MFLMYSAESGVILRFPTISIFLHSHLLEYRRISTMSNTRHGCSLFCFYCSIISPAFFHLLASLFCSQRSWPPQAHCLRTPTRVDTLRLFPPKISDE